MVDDEDGHLREWLACYTLPEVDEGLLERLVTRAENEAERAVLRRSVWFRSAAVLAAIGVLGYCSGSALVRTQASYAAAGNGTSREINWDRVILGPKSLYEVML